MAEDTLETLRAELAAAQKTVEDASKKLDSTPEQTLRDQISAAKREASNLQTLATLQETHGRLELVIARVDSDAGMAVVKRPNHLVFKRFINERDKKQTSVVMTDFVKACVVHPSWDEFERMVEEQPALLTRAADVAIWLGGQNREDVSKKSKT